MNSVKLVFANLLFALFSILSFAQTGAVSVHLTDSATYSDVAFANVMILKDSVIIAGNTTDINGRCIINELPVGTYDINFSSLGYGDNNVTQILVRENDTLKLDGLSIALSSSVQMMGCVTIAGDKKSISHHLQSISSMRAYDNGGALNIRGSRADANYYFIDGVKVKGGLPLSSEVIVGEPRALQGTPGAVFHSGKSRRRFRNRKVINQIDPYLYDQDTESYEELVENEFKSSRSRELSTFSIDVDNGSYTNSRRIINSGYLPPNSAVRLEEFINYFPYERVHQDDQHPFVFDTELGTCPWNEKNQLLRVTLQADELEYEEAPASNLVFLLDVSGSMSSANKLDLIKRAFSLLTDELRAEDRVSIVVYAGSSGSIIEGVKGNDKMRIKSALLSLTAGGSTAGGEGIELAYKLAEKHFIKDGNNRVILATDGDFNVGVSSDHALVKLIEKKRKTGVYLTTIGCGSGNYQDSKLEKLADHGNGSYAYIDTYAEARKVFLKELTGTLYAVANDVKFQIEFNPNKVSSYRLLGYENRMLADKDFADDTKDAGELGAGQMVTAFYEIVPASQVDLSDEEALRYRTIELSEASNSEEMLNLKIRYKQPGADTSILIEQPVVLTLTENDALSSSFVFGSSVVEAGLILRNSKFKADAGFDRVIARAQKAIVYDPDGYRREFISLIEMCDEMYATSD